MFHTAGLSVELLGHYSTVRTSPFLQVNYSSKEGNGFRMVIG